MQVELSPAGANNLVTLVEGNSWVRWRVDPQGYHPVEGGNSFERKLYIFELYIRCSIREI